MSLFKRLRAIAVVAMLWAVVWLPFGVALNMFYWPVLRPDRTIRWRAVLFAAEEGALLGAQWGVIGGVLFAATLIVAEGGRRVEHLSFRRALIWGAIAGVGFMALLTAWMVLVEGGSIYRPWRLAVPFALGAIYGTLVAGGILRTIRRAPVT
jgi:hypothetical protein